jgi:diguanylate cyclase (GGDEF)-like protein
VIVLERDYSGIAAAARKSSLVVAGVLEALLVALFLLLLPMLARATRRIRAHVAELDDLATHDELTGLANRVGFRRALGRALAGQGSGSVIVVDLDNFHEVNDTVGPEHADALLVAVAERMRELAGPEVVARLGEDEFGLLLSGDGEREIARVAEQVRRDFERPFTLGSARVALEGRAGCARFPEHGTDPVVLMRRAGVALTVAKATRRDVEIYDADHDQSDVSRLTLTAELREALRTGQLLVYYQPQADLATGAVRGAEALVRWNHPQRGLLTASEFILAAERSGLVVDIDRFVREEAARQWQEWRTLGIAIDVAVNVTAVELLDPRLPEEIETLLRRHQVPPEYLVLEITERTLLRDEHRTRQTLGRLHALGVRLAIDDYGTGYSSLSYLRKLPAQQVKLDLAFTAGIPGDTSNEAIVRSTIDLAHTLGATVVAEGVEDQLQWEHLAGFGCDIAQGYLIGKPLPAAELTRRLTNRPALRIVA